MGATYPTYPTYLTYLTYLTYPTYLETKMVEIFAHRRVAFAGRSFQALSIDDGDAAVYVTNEPGFLERAGNDRHRRPAGAKHHRKKFMAQLELVTVDAIMRHQQPATAALLHRMQRDTPGRLHDQHQQTL